MSDDFEKFESSESKSSDTKASSSLMSEVNNARSDSTEKKDWSSRIHDTASSFLADLHIVDATNDVSKPATDSSKPQGDSGSDNKPAESNNKPADSNKPNDSGSDNNKPEGGNKPADGSAKPADATPNQTELDKIQNDKDVRKEHNKMEDQITKLEKGLDPNSDKYKQLEAMRDNMEKFEERAASQKPPLKPEEVAKFYKEVGHMMEVKDGPGVPVKLEDRVVLAEQTMLHAANPKTIDQGDYNTCNVTTVEARMFTNNPSAAAHLISEVSTTGKYHSPGNPSVEVTVDPDSLGKHKDSQGNIESNNNPPKDGDRSYASQVFQVTAVNLSHKTHDMVVTDKDGNKVTYPAGSVEYRQGEGDPNAKPPHSGETLYDIRKNPPVPITDGQGDKNAVIHSPNLEDSHINDVYNTISGANPPEKGIVVASEGSYSGDGANITKIHSEEELKQTLEQAKKDGKLPLILHVNTGQEPFVQDSGSISDGGKGGPHVVTVTLDDNGKVIMDNQWGSKSKHEVDMHELYIATLTPKDAVKALEKDCAEDAKKGTVHYDKELELLRLRHNTGDVSDSKYTEQLAYLTQKAVQDAEKHGGTLDERTTKELQNQIDNLSKDQRKYIDTVCWETVTKSIMENNGRLVESDGKPIHTTYNPDDIAARNAAKLYEGGNQWIYYNKEDYDKMYSALQGKSPSELAAMDKQFQKDHDGMTMEQYINTSLKNHPEERDKCLKILHEQQGQYEQPKAA